MFTGGPALVKGALGEEVSKEELGGADVCAEIAGTAHNVAPDDPAAIELARRYLSFFPQNRWEPAPRRDGPDAGRRSLDGMLDIVPPSARQPYDMHAVLGLLVDEGSLLEIQPRFGPSLVTALAFLGGRSVAVIANNPAVGAGAVDSPAAQKAMDFIETAGHFNLPCIFLADNPGVAAGSQAEHSGILKWAGKMFLAQRRLRVPKLHVTMRKAFGFGSTTMAQNPFDNQTLTYALPVVNVSSMPAGTGGRTAKLDPETQARVEAEQLAGPWRGAAGMGYDEIIDPRELRNALIDGLDLLEGRRAAPVS